MLTPLIHNILPHRKRVPQSTCQSQEWSRLSLTLAGTAVSTEGVDNTAGFAWARLLWRRAAEASATPGRGVCWMATKG